MCIAIAAPQSPKGEVCPQMHKTYCCGVYQNKQTTSARKKIIMSLLTGITLISLINAQTTIILQPDAIQGKDAYLRSLSPNDNFGTDPDFSAHAWTNNGNEVIARGIIDFDLSGIDDTIEFNLFPVPASNAVTIDLKNISQESVSIGIFNSMGQLVEHQIDIQPVTTIDVSRYVKGLYFVRAYSGELVSTKKLIIE